MPGAKSAYQRKHMLPRAQKVDENPTTTDAERRPSLTEDHGGIISGGGGGGGQGKTWAKKRKEHLLARSGVTRAEGEETATAAIITDAAPPSKPKAPAGKSWEQKRKENLLTRMKPRGNDADIGLKAVVFVTRLRRLSNSRAASPELYPLPQAPASSRELHAGDICQIQGGRYAGSSGRLVAKVAAMDADDGEMAFVRLADGGRAIVPAAQLRPLAVCDQEGAATGSNPLDAAAATPADLLLARMVEKQAMLPTPAASGVASSSAAASTAATGLSSSVPDERRGGDMMNAVQKRRVLKRRAERRSRELRENLFEHVPDQSTC